jgi:hypothetical protein
MPNNIRQQPMWISTGDPESVNDTTLQEPGQLGGKATIIQPTRSASGVEAGRAKTYQLVQTDSTMTVSPYKGAIALWADKALYKVTTTVTNRNRIAGVFQNAVTPGNYGFIQTQGPASVKVLDSDMASLAIGDAIISSSTNAKATRVAVGTAPTHLPYGWVSGPAISTTPAEALVVVDLDVPDVP